MTPGARIQAAIEILDQILGGEAAERALTRWARASRFAGSKDRAAVRDHVFDALRQARSAGWAGGAGAVPFAGLTGRAIMVGLIRNAGGDTEAFFSGQGHAPALVTEPLIVSLAPEAVAHDCPDWLWPRLQADLGADAAPILAALRHRAPVHLRANRLKTDADTLIRDLNAQGFDAGRHPLAPDAVEVAGAPRGLDRTDLFATGHFEFQDVGSQALVNQLPDLRGARILDLCAGGGGKTLAMGAHGAGALFAHDAAAERMRDLPQRAARAGVALDLLTEPELEAPFDGVVADVPCSGSGSWRRAPEAKWRLTEARLDELGDLQSRILDRAFSLVRPGGWVAYMTCSLLRVENREQVDAALARTREISLEKTWYTTPRDGSDGFYFALLRKN